MNVISVRRALVRVGILGVLAVLAWNLRYDPREPGHTWLPVVAPDSPADLEDQYSSDGKALLLKGDGRCVFGDVWLCGNDTAPPSTAGSWTLAGSRITLEPTNAFGRYAQFETLRGSNKWLLLSLDPVTQRNYERIGTDAAGCFRPWGLRRYQSQ